MNLYCFNDKLGLLDKGIQLCSHVQYGKIKVSDDVSLQLPQLCQEGGLLTAGGLGVGKCEGAVAGGGDVQAVVGGRQRGRPGAARRAGQVVEGQHHRRPGARRQRRCAESRHLHSR